MLFKIHMKHIRLFILQVFVDVVSNTLMLLTVMLKCIFVQNVAITLNTCCVQSVL